MKKLSAMHKVWIKEKAYRKEYEALEEEFALASAMIAARARAGLTQDQLAKRMKTTQSTIARLESGRASPSGKTLQRFAEATGSRLRIKFESFSQMSKGRAGSKAASR
jgi:transcriptional regulator with XRE-family HTH domain